MKFIKYSCTGNDFLIADNRDGSIQLSDDQIRSICQRRTGVGADGIILLEKSEKDFKMKIINADASEAEMCGNGLRGISHFAKNYLDIPMNGKYQVETFNSVYESQVTEDQVLINMTEAYDENRFNLSFIDIEKKYFINTGVPHVVLFVSNVERVKVRELGSQIRYNEIFPDGTNVNFVEVVDSGAKRLKVRTYERGVEDETLACGTGNLACALAASHFFGWDGKIEITTKGGTISVDIREDGNWYCGPVTPVYEGMLDERASR
jgi:diaminopimelate epimerase